MAAIIHQSTINALSRHQFLSQDSRSSSLLHLAKPPNSLPSFSLYKTHLSSPTPTETPPRKTAQTIPSKNTNEYRDLLRLSVKFTDVELAMGVHSSILKLQENTLYLFNALIVAYFKLGYINHARKVFNTLKNPDQVTFTAMISGFSKSNQETEAVKVFSEMRSSGIDPNEYTFVAILTTCARILNLELGSQVHSLAIKLGFSEYTYVSNALMGFYSKCGCLDWVLKVFDEIPQRDIVSWNTVISVLVNELMYERALDLFRDMAQTNRFAVDHFTLSTLLAACTGCHALMEGRELHANALKFGFVNNLSVGNALIGYYSECRRIKDAVNLFDRMPVKDALTWTLMISLLMEFGHVDKAEEVFNKMPVKNCVSYNALLAGFCKNGASSRALAMFCRMVEQGLELDEFSLTSLIHAGGLHAEMQTSKQIHGFVLKFGYGLNNHVESALVDMCTRCGRMADAKKMFHSQPFSHDVSFIWTSIICGYARNGQSYEALSFFLKGQSRETVVIDKIVVATVLGLCATLGIDGMGKQIHCYSIKSGLLSDIGVGNALIGMYSKCGYLKGAVKAFHLMKRHDVVSWNSLLAGYILHRQGDEALALWAKMEKKNIRPDSITAMSIISAYAHTSSNVVDQCRRFFLSMETTYNIRPTSDHYASMVGVFAHWGYMKEAEEIIDHMPFEPDFIVWRALLDGCKTHSGKLAAKEILAKKPYDVSTYVLVANLYSESGRWDRSWMTREEMRERGYKKQPAQTWIVHQNEVHSFYSREKSHIHFKDVSRELDLLVPKCLKAGYIPDTSFVLHNVEDHNKSEFLYYHSAKLAVSYGLMVTRGRTPVRVMKNILLCGDCHNFIKYVSVVTKREIHVRDTSGFHCFVNGQCSCKSSSIDPYLLHIGC